MRVFTFGVLLVALFFYFGEIESHGMLMQPVNRASAWRKGFRTPINYDDNANYCGGFNVSFFSFIYPEKFFNLIKSFLLLTLLFLSISNEV